MAIERHDGPYTPEQEAAIERLVDSGVASYADAVERLGLRSPASTSLGRTGTAAYLSRPSRRGGRAFSTGNENELDPYWNSSSSPGDTLTPEERDRNKAGINQVRGLFRATQIPEYGELPDDAKAAYRDAWLSRHRLGRS